MPILEDKFQSGILISNNSDSETYVYFTCYVHCLIIVCLTNSIIQDENKLRNKSFCFFSDEEIYWDEKLENF